MKLDIIDFEEVTFWRDWRRYNLNPAVYGLAAGMILKALGWA